MIVIILIGAISIHYSGRCHYYLSSLVILRTSMSKTHIFPRGLNWWLTNGTTRLIFLSLPVCVNVTRVIPLHYLELAVSISRDGARTFPLRWFALVVSQDSAKVSLVLSH